MIKKLLAFLLFLGLMAQPAWADSKLTDLVNLTSVDLNDTMYIVDATDSGDTASQKVTPSNLFGAATDLDVGGTISANAVALTTDTTGDYVASVTNGTYITGGDGGSEGAGLTLDVTVAKDIVTTAPLTGAQDNVLPGADADLTLAITVAKDLVTTAPLTGGTDNILTGSDADVTLAITVAKDLVTTTPIQGGTDNILTGSDADVTMSFDFSSLALVTADGADTVLIHDASDSGALKAALASDFGGAEVNNLETITTGIADTEIVVGTGADTAAYVNMSGEATIANTGAVTLADSVAVTSWNLTTPTITTSLTTDGKTISEAELGILDGGIEGTEVLSTGESGGTKFLREDGDGTCSWQAAAGGAEVNNLETICTDIASTEIPIGTAADTVVYAALSGEATMANDGAVTLADSVAVSSWNLTTPTITTSLTTSTPTTISAAELDRLDGLAGIIATDTNICTDLEGTGLTLGAGTLNVDDAYLKLGGDTATAGTYDFGSADVILEIPNAAAPTTDATGEMAIDTNLITQGMLQVYLASAIANVVATTDTPGDNEVPTYDLAGGTVQWEASAAGFADPMTTRGDIIIRDATNTTARLAVGGADEVLTSDGTDIAWAAASGGGLWTDMTPHLEPNDDGDGVWLNSSDRADSALIWCDGTDLEVDTNGLAQVDIDVPVSVGGSGMSTFPTSIDGVVQGYIKGLDVTWGDSDDTVVITSGSIDVNGVYIEAVADITHTIDQTAVTSDWIHVFIDNSSYATALDDADMYDTTTDAVWSDTLHGFYSAEANRTGDRYIGSFWQDGSSNVDFFVQSGNRQHLFTKRVSASSLVTGTTWTAPDDIDTNAGTPFSAIEVFYHVRAYDAGGGSSCYVTAKEHGDRSQSAQAQPWDLTSATGDQATWTGWLPLGPSRQVMLSTNADDDEISADILGHGIRR